MFYYFTAFVRSHKYFNEFELNGSCFEKMKENKAIAAQYNQPADFNTVDEILSKDITSLKFCINDE
jgi:hypothetical protein